MSKSGARQASQQVEKQYYQKVAKHYTPQPPLVKNCVKAFLVGGTVCLLGQTMQFMYVQFFGFSEAQAHEPTVATLIFFACLLTGFGVYDKLGRWAGAGTAVPVTGFANAMAAAAVEHNREGWVVGVGGQMFKLTGPVIVFGVVAAFLIALAKTIVT